MDCPKAGKARCCADNDCRVGAIDEPRGNFGINCAADEEEQGHAEKYGWRRGEENGPNGKIFWQHLMYIS